MNRTPPDEPSYHGMWHMSEVGDAGRHRGGPIRWGLGLVGGIVGLAPFVPLALAIWGAFRGHLVINGGGFAVLLIGLVVGLCLGGYMATQSD